MNRLLVFALGLLLGALGVYALVVSGHLRIGTRLPMEGIPGVRMPVPPPTDRIVLPDAPSLPASVSTPALAPVAPMAPLPGADAEGAPMAGEANASEQPAPDTLEATAALMAATAAGRLLMPVQGVQPAQIADTFTQSRGAGRLHDAIDIMAPRGTPVLAVAEGRVAKLFESKPGGLTLYQFDREEKLAFYYAHLDRYAPGLVEGRVVKRGDLIGFVGSTGNASPDGPHLHFAVFVLGPEKNWWKGTAVNPYPLLGGR